MSVGNCNACCQRPCKCIKVNGKRQPYEDDCDHEYDEDEDTLEFVCTLCGDRQPIPLDKIMRG